MKKKLPFEEAIEGKLGQVPLPGKEQSWRAMDELLNKNKKRRRAFYFRRFIVAIALLLITAGGVWLFIKKEENKNTAAQQHANSLAQQKENITQDNKNSNTNSNAAITTINNNNNTLKNTASQDEIKNTTSIKAQVAAKEEINTTIKHTTFINRGKTKGKVRTRVTAPGIADGDNGIVNDVTGISKQDDDSISDDGNNKAAVDEETQTTTSSSTSILADNTGKKDDNISNTATIDTDRKDSSSIAVKKLTAPLPLDTTATTTQTTATKKIKEKKAGKKYVWSAGLGLQQQIPVAGQQISPYGYNGNKTVIHNYIPSVYVRLQHKQRWFARAEFSYGAPRSVAPFAYNRVSKVNNASTELSVTTLSLVKTYYHELPVSFNYFIKKKWSIGAGVTYGLLHRSVSEKNTTTTNLVSGEGNTTTQIIPAAYTDSFLYKSQWQWFLQTEYEWKRFSAGLRYSADALPYIKYTLPNGQLYQRRNNLLGVFIRVRVF